MNIGVITGGNWPERDISLLSSQSTLTWLQELWHQTSIYDTPRDISTLTTDLQSWKNDFYFIMIHWEWWEDGKISSLLDVFGARYQTARSDCLALTINKYRTKCIRQDADLPTAHHYIWDTSLFDVHEAHKHIIRHIWNTCVIKQTSLGSSKWVHICRSEEEIIETLHIYKEYDGIILVEELLIWEEITISILDIEDKTVILPPILIIPPEDWAFDYENKYNGKTQEICPAPLDVGVLKKAESIAYLAYQAVWCRSYARIDMMLTQRWPALIEINTIPWFTTQSLFPLAAKTYGIEFNQLLEILIENGL